MGSECDVPEQVLFDILLYLPVISLLRFKTVCKSWFSIIESSIFVAQHLHHNSEKNNLIVHSYAFKLFMLCGRQYELRSNLDFEGIYPMDKLKTVNSCDGIVCLAYMLSRDYWCLALWNPATKQVRQVPEPSYLAPSEGTILFHTFCFGFDVKTNDYKIISLSLDCGSDCFLEDSLVQIYSVRTDSWRTIHSGDDFPISWIDILINVVCNNGICLWIGGSDLDSAVIFYFDLMDEVYGIMSLPVHDDDVGAVSLAFINGKVSYVKYKLGGESCSCYEIWTMDEFGVNESWSKVYNVEDSILPCDRVRLVNLLKNGDSILTSKYWYSDDDSELCLLDLVTQEEKSLNVHDARSVISYSESLVSVKRTTGTS